MVFIDHNDIVMVGHVYCVLNLYPESSHISIWDIYKLIIRYPFRSNHYWLERIFQSLLWPSYNAIWFIEGICISYIWGYWCTNLLIYSCVDNPIIIYGNVKGCLRILGMCLDAVLCFSDELNDKDPSLSMFKTDWSIGV